MPAPVATPYPLTAIKVHDRLQVRGGTNPATVKSYANAMLKGEVFIPIQLAEIGGNLYVVDGHHRLEAAHQAGRLTIDATRQRMSLNDAHVAALGSNGGHGRNLTQKEKQAALQGYIDADLHLHCDSDDLMVVNGSVKSLRTIAAECPFYHHTHIGRKLKALGIEAPRDDIKPYHPGYREDEDEEDIALEETIVLTAFRQHLDAAMASYGLLGDTCRATALEALRGLVDALQPPSDTQASTLEV